MYLYHSKLADPAWLEKMLFGRRDTADWLEKTALLFAETGKATHLLLVGNRGMGKSHLMSVLYHRLLQKEIVRNKVVIAYLEEDPYGIADYLDLLRHILKAIAQKELHEPAKQRLQEAHQMLISTAPAQRISTAQDILLTHLAGRRLLLMAENLNNIFEALGEAGQSRWRDFLQTHDNTMICATSQAIFSDLQSRERPFFGFFHITYLQKLSYEEARGLLLAMAEMQQNTALIEYIDTPEGEAKLRAIFELTEGNHRLLVAFFDFFMAEFRAELSKSFLRTVDQLKPYYESFLKLLPPQQQKIVKFLVQERIPQPGRNIVDNCFLPANTLSKQMSELQRLGYVQNTRQGRDAYYEITEPMLRMCLESNENTDGILSIFVDFLGNLYPAKDLKFHFLRFNLMADLSADHGLRAKLAEEAYLYQKAVKRYAADWEPDMQQLSMVREAPMQEQEQTIRRMVEDSEYGIYEDQLYGLIDNKQYREAEQLLEKVFPDHLSHYYWRLLGYLSLVEGRASEAEASYRKSIEIKATDSLTWYEFGRLLLYDQRIKEAEAACRKAVEINPDFYQAWSNLGLSFTKQERSVEAEAAYKKSIEVNPLYEIAWQNLGALFLNTNRIEEAIDAFNNVLEIDPTNEVAWLALVKLFINLKQLDRVQNIIQLFLDKNKGNQLEQGAGLMAFDLILWSTGNKSYYLDNLKYEEILEYGDKLLTSLFLQIFAVDKSFALSVFNSTHFDLFLKKCKKMALPSAVQNATSLLLRSDIPSAAKLHNFHAALTEAFGQKISMYYPLKFLHLGIRHVKENDPKALLELTVEERRVFEREVLAKLEQDDTALADDFPK